jgi:UrcA family protein
VASGNDSQINTLETAMNRITTIILTSALAVGAQMAHAADPTDASLRHVKVLYSDLDLTSIDGATTLYRRLQSAAESVCAEHGTKGPGSVFRVKTCVSAAVSAAVADINQPTLTAYYRAKHSYTTAAVRQASR